MAEKPPEEGYISVVDEEPEILQLLKWDSAPVQKEPEQPCVELPQQPKTVEKRSSKWQENMNPFDLSDQAFIETYRLSKELVRSLSEELKAVMPDSVIQQSGFSVEHKVMAAISFYATGKYQKIVCGKSDPNISQYLMTTAVIHVTEAMNHPTIVKKYIHFPHLMEEREVIKTRFYVKYGVPNVVGCIDCTHVPIIRPDGDQKSHFNKFFHSQKVQIICDSDLTITSVEPCPGSHSHDSILSRHAVRVDLDSLNQAGEQCYLLGGPYHVLKRYMMTPIPKITKKSPSSPQKYYNTIHSQTHSTVSLAIKHLKSRWKCLQATCNKQLDPATVSMMIVACCVLHNICNRHGMPIPALTPAEERLETMKQKLANGPVPKKMNDDQEGLQVRAMLMDRLWNERRLPEPNSSKKRKKDRVDVPLPHPPPLQPAPAPALDDDPSKRQRVGMNPPPPSYVMPHVTVWGHYPHH